jgi:dipeptidase E
MQLLLLSNSTNAGEAYLEWPQKILHDFITENNIKSCLFVPYAGVTVSWDDYFAKVAGVFETWNCEVTSVHHTSNPILAVASAECIIVGGGNTFRLVQLMQQTGIMAAIREKVISGIPYIGWSAGSNVACPTLRTTNDMPVIQPVSFDCLNLVPFQINPHYLDANPEGHGGETREQRIMEFLELNPELTVFGLREATALHINEHQLHLLGNRNMRVFSHASGNTEVAPGTVLDSYLL